jgi:hypothetical protein
VRPSAARTVDSSAEAARSVTARIGLDSAKPGSSAAAAAAARARTARTSRRRWAISPAEWANILLALVVREIGAGRLAGASTFGCAWSYIHLWAPSFLDNSSTLTYSANLCRYLNKYVMASLILT